MTSLLSLAQKTVAAAMCGVLLCSATACGRDKEAAVESTVEQQDKMLNRTVLYPNDLNVDYTSPDSVSEAFVEVIENHDAATEKEEWASVARATDLMTPSAAQAYTADFNGGTETRWEDWLRWDAFTTAIPAFSNDVRPPDTETEAYRVIDAHIQVETPGDHAAQDLIRSHFLMLRNIDGKWLVARWNVASPVEKPKEY